MLRAELDKLTKNNDEQAKHEAILKARDITERIAEEAVALNKSGRLMGADYRKVLTAIANLFVHLNNRYEGDKNLNEGVRSMLIELDFKKIEDTDVYKKGKLEQALEMAKKMLLKNKPIEEIVEFTELTEQEVKDIQKTVKANA